MEVIKEQTRPVEGIRESTDDRPWEDIVFENRNQDYGAYVLRKEYGNTMIFAFIMTLLLTILFIVLI